MAAKPAIALARFADQIGANLVSPTSGERDLGFGNGTTATSGKVNWQINQLYQWALYLSDGALVGDHSIAGNLTVGGQALTFTPAAFTADNTTDQLAITAHGLATGDGPFRLTTTGALPSGLLTATDYWIIRIDANHFQLAQSLLNALQGLAFDFTSNGTGTHTISGNSPTHATDVSGSRDVAISGTISAGSGAVIGGRAVTFSAQTFTANSGTDLITLVGHGLATGDGPFTVSNSGGGLPGGLAAATNYWAIRVGVDTLKLATTRERAIGGVAIDLTSNGTGTQTITGNSPTRAADATITGALRLEGGEYFPTRTLRFPAGIGLPQNSTDTWSQEAGGVLGTPLVQWVVSLALPDGVRITGIRARVKDAGSTTLTLIATKSVDAVETGILGASVSSAASAAWQTLSKSGTETTVSGTNYYATVFTASGTGAGHFAWVEVDIDRLPA